MQIAQSPFWLESSGPTPFAFPHLNGSPEIREGDGNRQRNGFEAGADVFLARSPPRHSRIERSELGADYGGVLWFPPDLALRGSIGGGSCRIPYGGKQGHKPTDTRVCSPSIDPFRTNSAVLPAVRKLRNEKRPDGPPPRFCSL